MNRHENKPLINLKTHSIMAIFVRLEQSKNKTKSSFGKWYLKTVKLDEVHTEEMARNICDNTTFKRSEVKGIIDELVSEMKHQMQMGHVVVLDGLGRFHLSAESEGVADKRQFNLGKHLRRVVCKFLPAGHRDPQTGEITRNFVKGTKVEWMKE